MDLFKKIQKFFSYWYVRYLLATELYMVETWEKAVVHVVFVLLFALDWWFNCSIVLSGIEHLRGSANHMKQIS